MPVSRGNTALVLCPATAAPISVELSQAAPLVTLECLNLTLPPTRTSKSVAKSQLIWALLLSAISDKPSTSTGGAVNPATVTLDSVAHSDLTPRVLIDLTLKSYRSGSASSNLALNVRVTVKANQV
ncbi:MAG: hypothetical protein HOH03_10590, partial [Candidatus Marinimicrobia bacterium]|nr:hypothetical protein [Candidatus Neomarinimicrobiota bacterium]